jgi:hypothetical protein
LVLAAFFLVVGAEISKLQIKNDLITNLLEEGGNYWKFLVFLYFLSKSIKKK